MPQRRRRSWSELARLQERLNQLLEQAVLGAEPELDRDGSATWRPPLDLIETPDELVVYVELPGVRRDQVQLQADGRLLELSGRREPHEGDHSYLRLEGCYGAFRRRLELPAVVDASHVEATLRRGLLEVRLPKQQSARGAAIPIGED
ncbi:MAG TPA: Hsp20/alpha crystallin family protein [Thermoanaerobaculia bacterium]|nr:Hsp20/alpha crystallin family protein [Thermoanaerobaculia bacterium]